MLVNASAVVTVISFLSPVVSPFPERILEIPIALALSSPTIRYSSTTGEISRV